MPDDGYLKCIELVGRAANVAMFLDQLHLTDPLAGAAFRSLGLINRPEDFRS